MDETQDRVATLAVELARAQGSGDRFAEATTLRAAARAFTGRSRSDSPTMRLFGKLVFGSSGCWVWSGALSALGYGIVTRTFGEVVAHRFSWALHNGPVPGGMHVLHRCDVRSCVNPEHLFLGTHTDNMRDMAAKGRGVTPNLRGERNPQSRLTSVAVDAIRAEYAAGGISMKALAAKHGVTTMTVCRAVNHQTWRNK